MYKLVNWVDDEIKKENKNSPEIAQVGNNIMITVQSVIKDYPRGKSNDPAEIRDIIQSAVYDNFLLDKLQGSRRMVFVNPGPGKRFLRKSFRKIPTGFFKEVAKDNFITLSILSGFLGGAYPSFDLFT